MTEEYYLKFPSIFKDKLKSGEIQFPENTLVQYESIVAYRGIERDESDDTPVNRNDLKSYAELGKVKAPRGAKYDVNSPNYYGCSLFLNKKKVENALKLPRAGRKLAVICVKEEGGPIQLNDETQHVCWWLYEAYNEIEAKIIK